MRELPARKVVYGKCFVPKEKDRIQHQSINVLLFMSPGSVKVFTGPDKDRIPSSEVPCLLTDDAAVRAPSPVRELRRHSPCRLRLMGAEDDAEVFSRLVFMTSLQS